MATSEIVIQDHRKVNQNRNDLIQKFAALAGLVFLVIAFSLTSNSFLTTSNGITLALQTTTIAFLGFGATCVIITGGIDLSVGSVLALAGVVAGMAAGRRYGRANRSLIRL